MDWQPIETAPKNGTTILGWSKNCGEVLLVRWIAPVDFLSESELEASGLSGMSKYAQDWFYADFVRGDRLEGVDVPTHWMPLPQGPVK